MFLNIGTTSLKLYIYDEDIYPLWYRGTVGLAKMLICLLHIYPKKALLEVATLSSSAVQTSILGNNDTLQFIFHGVLKWPLKLRFIVFTKWKQTTYWRKATKSKNNNKKKKKKKKKNLKRRKNLDVIVNEVISS